MPKRSLWLSLVLGVSFGFVAAIAQAAEDTLEIVLPSGKRSFTLQDLKAKLPVVTVNVDDPVYGKKKSFDGFKLWDVLKLAGDAPAGADEMIFEAKDGYAPTIAIEKARSHPAIIAFQEHGTEGKWEPVTQGKAKVSPAPYYVVWEEGKKLSVHEFPFSYQLARIGFIHFSEKFSKMFPQDAKAKPAVVKGFATFKNNCISCHSVNLQGGELAPELNVPRSVTEYWTRANLKAFVLHPESFRLRSKMPTFGGKLSEAEVDGVLDYLEFMKEHKILPKQK